MATSTQNRGGVRNPIRRLPTVPQRYMTTTQKSAQDVGVASPVVAQTTGSSSTGTATQSPSSFTPSNPPTYGGLNWTSFTLPGGSTGWNASFGGLWYYFGPDGQLYQLTHSGEGNGKEQKAGALGSVTSYFAGQVPDTITAPTNNSSTGNNTTATGTTATDPLSTLASVLSGLTASGAAQQSVPDSTAATVTPTQTSSGPNYAIPILLVVIAAALGYYYYKHHHKSAA